MNKKSLQLALEMISQGALANVPEMLRAEALDRHENAKPWMQSSPIQGFGIGFRKSEGKTFKQLALKVYVDKKIPDAELGESLVPKALNFTGLGQEIITDVEAIGKVTLELDTVRHRPAFPGCGVGHPDITVGTFGCLVTKKGKPSGDLYILSNSHVLANEGLASAGDRIVQPGNLDGGRSPADDIAELSEFISFDFGSGFENLVDAAIAKVLDKSQVISKIGTIGVPPSGIGAARVGTRVKKTGRTTGFSRGEVLDVDFRTSLEYRKPGGGKGFVNFRDQVLCTRYTQGGDSGSAVLHETSNKILGLHFAGSSSTSIFNKIGNVISALGIEIVTK